MFEPCLQWPRNPLYKHSPLQEMPHEQRKPMLLHAIFCSKAGDGLVGAGVPLAAASNSSCRLVVGSFARGEVLSRVPLVNPCGGELAGCK